MKIIAVVLLFALCAAGANGSCESPWEEKDGSCYQFVKDDDKTWENAKTFCEDNEGYLVQIDSEEEDDAMFPVFDKNEKRPAYSVWWIGLKKSGDAWTWVDGTEPTYTNFFNKLDTEIDAQCVGKMMKKWSGYKWYNYKCGDETEKRPFICEKPL